MDAEWIRSARWAIEYSLDSTNGPGGQAMEYYIDDTDGLGRCRIDIHHI